MNADNKPNVKKALWLPIAGCIAFAILSVTVIIVAMSTPASMYPLKLLNTGGTFRFNHTRLGGAEFETYYLLYGCGFIGGMILLQLRAGRFGVSRVMAAVTDVYLLIFGFAGAKLMYILEDMGKFRLNGFTFGGVSFFGTVFFLPIFLIPLALAQKKNIFDYYDYCLTAIIQMLIFIRIGCFTAGCCGGISVYHMEKQVVLPTQLMEIALDFALLTLIVYMDRTDMFRRGRYFIFMGGYGVLRFILEFIRDTAKTTLGMSHGQWFAIIAMLICVVYLAVTIKNHNSGRKMYRK